MQNCQRGNPINLCMLKKKKKKKKRNEKLIMYLVNLGVNILQKNKE